MNTCRLLLVLKTGKTITWYSVRPIPDTHPDVAVKAWRLTKLGGEPGEFYDVMNCPKGFLGCTCKDSTYRQRACKHIRAARALGLLPKEPK